MFQQGSMGQTAAVNILSGSAQLNQAPTPPTLMRAMSRSDELNCRLADLSKAVQEIAIAIGGPWPCDNVPSAGKPSPDKPPAMEVLNDRLDFGHAKVSDIEQSVQAIRRTLGA